MVYVLGLHLGHDASASVISEKGIESSILQERHTRIRHDFGLDIRTIDLALKSAGVRLSQITAVGVTGTQLMPIVNRSVDSIKIFPRHSPEPKSDNVIHHGRDWLDEKHRSVFVISQQGPDPTSKSWQEFRDFLSLDRRIPNSELEETEFFLVNDPLRAPTDFSAPRNIDKVIENYFSSDPNGADALSMNHEFEIQIHSQIMPAYFWSHHASHAASNVIADSRPRNIYTHDGGTGVQSGGVWRWDGQSLRLIVLHQFEIGQLYDYCAMKLGLGSIGGAGKLMGLAAYGGQKMISHSIPLGNRFDLIRYFQTDLKNESLYELFFSELMRSAASIGIDVSGIGDPARVTELGPTEIAFAVQKYAEDSFSKFVGQIEEKNNFGSVGISGGFALNCPTNSKIWNLLRRDLVIEPHCEDGGCSLGAANLALAKVSGDFNSNSVGPVSSSYAYLGSKHSRLEPTIFRRAQLRLKGYKVSKPKVMSESIAMFLSENKVGACLSGQSETGPRALGHRSILSNPSILSNWARVNRVKNREEWRPFAPAVLVEDSSQYFVDGPPESPFMLINYTVTELGRELLPAITHVDDTARVQTVKEDDGLIHKILVALKRLGLPPVVMNTSFNGPGEPIVENFSEAFSLFEKTDLDFVQTGKFLITKASY